MNASISRALTEFANADDKIADPPKKIAGNTIRRDISPSLDDDVIRNVMDCLDDDRRLLLHTAVKPLTLCVNTKKRIEIVTLIIGLLIFVCSLPFAVQETEIVFSGFI